MGRPSTNWKPLWDWAKKVGGLIVATVIAPYVTSKYGPGWGAVVGGAGAAALHQARRFGDGKRLNRQPNPQAATLPPKVD